VTDSPAARSHLVFDASALFNLGHRGRLEFLVEKLAARHHLGITEVVRGEIKDPDRAVFYERFLSAFRVTPHDAVLPETGIPLDAGEISVLAACLHLGPAARPILDETPGRRAARALGLDPWDTLDLINLALREKWLTDDQCMEAVARIREAGGFIPKPGPNDFFSDYFSASRLRRKA
jgi:predicted nucleic acid-binding protein